MWSWWHLSLNRPRLCHVGYTSFNNANRKPYRSFRIVPFQWSWVTPNPDFKVTPLFDAECLINGTRCKHSYKGILIGTYTRPTQACHFKWPSATLSDSLLKFSEKKTSDWFRVSVQVTWKGYGVFGQISCFISEMIKYMAISYNGRRIRIPTRSV